MTDNDLNSFKRRKQDQNNDDVSTTTSNDLKSTNSDLLREASEALQESNKIHVRPIVDEAKLGIELFVGDRKNQFHGIIKTRYADFIVHEIDHDDNLVELIKLDPPEETGPCNVFNIEDLVSNKDIECITEVNNGYLNQYKIDVSGLDKETRTELHQAIRTNFDRVESSTISETHQNESEPENKTINSEGNDDKPDKPDSTQQVDGCTDQVIDTTTPNDKSNEANSIERKYILVTRRSKMSRPKNLWPRDRPDYTHFVLYKENKDTMEAIYNLAASVNTRPSNFASAGVKDRRAVTSQWISCWRLEPKRLVAAVRRYNKHPFIKVGNFCFKKEPLRLGHLNGNRFDIVVRNLIHNSLGEESINNAMNAIKENGFINYFGLQRFGTRTIQTHEVGLAILQGQWEKAVDLILSYRFDDNMHPPIIKELDRPESLNSGDCNSSAPPASEGRNKSDSSKRYHNDASQHNSFIDLWKSKLDAEIVFKKYPHFRYSNEGTIMKFLSKSEESSRDYMNALISLPRSTRSMYVHSYQSLIWNKAVTYRLKKHGFKVIPGDLILCPSSNITDNSLDLLLSADEINDSSVDDATTTKTPNADAKLNNNNHLRKAPIEEIESKLKLATQEDVDKYTIFDVVLPIVGSRTKLPENDVGQEIERLLTNDHLELGSFKKNERLFISFGSYRKMMVKPKNVNWSLKQYSHPQQNLVETDIDRLIRDLKLKDIDGSTSSRLASAPVSDSSDEALVVSFELPPSSYATMCLREIMKQSSTEFNSKF